MDESRMIAKARKMITGVVAMAKPGCIRYSAPKVSRNMITKPAMRP